MAEDDPPIYSCLDCLLQCSHFSICNRQKQPCLTLVWQ